MASDQRIYSEVGRLVKKTRNALHLTQDELAQRVGLTRTSITNIESGRQKIQIHVLYTIAEAMSVDIRDLLPASSVRPKEETTTLLHNSIKHLRSTEREWIERVLGETRGEESDEQ